MYVSISSISVLSFAFALYFSPFYPLLALLSIFYLSLRDITKCPIGVDVLLNIQELKKGNTVRYEEWSENIGTSHAPVFSCAATCTYYT